MATKLYPSEIFESQRFYNLRPFTQLLFERLWRLADDRGCIGRSCPFLRGAILRQWPGGEKTPNKAIIDALQELATAGFVMPYEDGEPLLYLRFHGQFLRHKLKVKYPAPPASFYADDPDARKKFNASEWNKPHQGRREQRELLPPHVVKLHGTIPAERPIAPLTAALGKTYRVQHRPGETPEAFALRVAEAKIRREEKRARILSRGRNITGTDV